MLFRQKCKRWRILFLLPFAAAGCVTTTPTRVSEAQPAVIMENGSCHEAIEAAMQTMAGSDRIRLTPDVFRTKPLVLLSNYTPSEMLPGASPHFSEAADKRFLLHIDDRLCLLSLVDEDNRLITTEKLSTCVCTTVP